MTLKGCAGCLLGTVVLIVLCVFPFTSGRPALSVLSYYETLNYDPSELAAQHMRMSRTARRSGNRTHSSGSVSLNIKAFNRTFESSLRHSKKLFGKSVKFLVNGKPTTAYDPLTFYEGPLHGEPGSKVVGHVIDGIFSGVLHTRHGKFHVENAHKFFGHTHSQDFHSIVYHEHDVTLPPGLQPATCGMKQNILEHLNSVSSHAVPLSDSQLLYGDDRHTILRRQMATNNKYCQVRVVADHRFLENSGNSIPVAMVEMAAIISSVQDIYQDADFDGNGAPDGIQPVVASLEVFELSRPNYRFGRSVIEVNDFLDLWSQEDQSGFCLALLLTHRDFSNGVLGLAWVAQPSGGNRGGICEQRVRLGVGERFLNTGIVTTLNYGQTQPRSVTEVTVAHEFGHNFGSPHDPSGSCSPGIPQGNFIMFPQATDGSLRNNKIFSQCSLNSIGEVLNDKSACFTQNTIFCGNGIIEEGEECDCGASCDQDSCCNGQNCTLTQGSQCSSLSMCCMSNCRFISNATTCRSETECGEASLCTGSDAACPSASPKENVILCNGGRNTCIMGVCAGSLCITQNYTDCQCTTGSSASANALCHVCCVGGPNNVPCQSSFTLFPGIGENQRSGRSCNNFEGYCSNSNPPRCIVVDNEQTLNDLLDIFTIATLNRIVAWLRVYWYIPVGVVVGLLIIFILLQLTYRRRKPIRKRLTEMRRASTIRREGRQNVGSAQTGGVGSGRGSGGQERQRNREISRREAEQRLSRFFPTADGETMVTIMQVARSESKAVQRLIDLGFPLRRLPLPRS